MLETSKETTLVGHAMAPLVQQQALPSSLSSKQAVSRKWLDMTKGAKQ